MATARQVRFNIGNIYEIDNFGSHRRSGNLTDRSARYIYADQSPGDSGIRASWSCQPYIRCCSQRSLYGCSWWTPGYPTERRLWVGWLWAEAWKYQAGFYGSKVPGAQVGHSMAGVGLQVPAQQHTAAHELVVSSHFFSRWGTCHWISLGHGRRWCMCLVQNLAAS